MLAQKEAAWTAADEGTNMGKPIMGATSAPITQVSGSGSQPTQAPTQSPIQSAPSKPDPMIDIWPPAYGWRRSASEGNREAHNGWQQQWLQVGARITGGSIDSVAALKPLVEPLLRHGRHGRWS